MRKLLFLWISLCAFAGCTRETENSEQPSVEETPLDHRPEEASPFALTASLNILVAPPPLTEYAIIAPDKMIMDQPYQLHTSGKRGDRLVDVASAWSLQQQVEGVTLTRNGHFSSTVAGTFTVNAQAEDQTATLQLTVRDRSLEYSSSQFWVYKTDSARRLVFNTPWDKEDGDDVIESADNPNVPEYARACAIKARDELDATLEKETIADRVAKLLALKATPDVMILVNAIDSVEHKKDLAAFDRDAYFSHSNGKKERPSLTMSRFKVGQWIWEVIAHPNDGCVMPREGEMIRYLDYATARLTSKK